MIGFIFCLFGDPILWRSCLQPIMALSMTEVEYIDVTEVVKEALWLKGLALKMGLAREAVRVYCDNQSALLFAQNSVYQARMKYIDIRYHQIRELMEKGKVELVKVHTKKNPADALTKVLSQDSFRKCMTLIYLMDMMELVEALRHQGGDCWVSCGALKAQGTKAKAKVQSP